MSEYGGNNSFDLGAALPFMGIGPQAKQDKALLDQQTQHNQSLEMQNQAFKGYLDHVMSISDPLERANRLNPQYFQQFTAGQANQANARQSDAAVTKSGFDVNRGQQLLPGELQAQKDESGYRSAATGTQQALTGQAQAETERAKAERGFLERTQGGAPTVAAAGVQPGIDLQKAQIGNFDSENQYRQGQLGIESAKMFGEDQRMQPGGGKEGEFLSVLAGLPGATGKIFQQVQAAHGAAQKVKSQTAAAALFNQYKGDPSKLAMFPQYQEEFSNLARNAPAPVNKPFSGQDFTIPQKAPSIPEFQQKATGVQSRSNTQPVHQSFMPQGDLNSGPQEILRQLLQTPDVAKKAQAGDQQAGESLRQVIEWLNRRTK